MQTLCDIDLIKTVHARKVKLLQEEEREREMIERKKEEELQRKMKHAELARIEQEKINRRKFLEEVVVDKTIDMGISDVDILRIENENEKDLIEIKKIDMEEEEKEIIDDKNHNILLNNKLDGSYRDMSDVNLQLEKVMDHDENYENEDPDDEEDIENEMLDEEMVKNNKEVVRNSENNLLSSGSSSSKCRIITFGSRTKHNTLFHHFPSFSDNTNYLYLAVIFIFPRAFSLTYRGDLHYHFHNFYL